MNTIILINILSRIIMVKIGIRMMLWYLWCWRHITDDISLVGGDWGLVHIWWCSGVAFIWRDLVIITNQHGLDYLCVLEGTKNIIKLFDDLSQTYTYVFVSQ